MLEPSYSSPALHKAKALSVGFGAVLVLVLLWASFTKPTNITLGLQEKNVGLNGKSDTQTTQGVVVSAANFAEIVSKINDRGCPKLHMVTSTTQVELTHPQKCVVTASSVQITAKGFYRSVWMVGEVTLTSSGVTTRAHGMTVTNVPGGHWNVPPTASTVITAVFALNLVTDPPTNRATMVARNNAFGTPDQIGIKAANGDLTIFPQTYSETLTYHSVLDGIAVDYDGNTLSMLFFYFNNANPVTCYLDKTLASGSVSSFGQNGACCGLPNSGMTWLSGSPKCLMANMKYYC